MRESGRSSWIDISVPLQNSMTNWPGDPPFSVRIVQDIERGDAINLSALSMGSHSGTHVDAPSHFISGGIAIDRAPLDTMVGRARVIEIKDAECIKPEELAGHRIRRGERILFKTRNSSYCRESGEFAEDYVFISDRAASFLVDRGVRLVGVDSLSVGSFSHGGDYVHQVLLSAGVWIIEGLDLSQVGTGRYDLICLPLRLAGRDGAPARAILRPVTVTERSMLKDEGE